MTLLTPLVFHGRLLDSPFEGELFLSDIRPGTLETEMDFVAYAQLARPNWAPVWMSFPQKCRFLGSIVQHIVDTVWDDIDLLLMICRVPGIRMPLELGQEKIFQVVELEPEIERLAALGQSFLSMDEGFVRHPMEIGNNDLRLQWHLPRGAQAVPHFERLCERLRALGLVDLHRATAGRLHASPAP